MNSRMMVVALFATWTLGIFGQDFQKDYDAFVKEAKGEYANFRKQCLEDYAEFVRMAWKEYGVHAPEEKPKEQQIVHPVIAEIDKSTESWLGDQLAWVRDKIKTTYQKISKKNKKDENQQRLERERRQLTVKTVVTPELKEDPQPQPLSPVEDVPMSTQEFFAFQFFGTDCKVRLGDDCRFSLRGLETNDVADVLRQMTATQYDNLLFDCLQLRKDLHLSDWAYYEMLCAVTDSFYGRGSNEATMALAFLYSQSGYKMRLGHDDKNLYMLVATRHNIYSYSYFVIDNERFYVLRGNEPQRMFISEAKFPKESQLSLQIPHNQRFVNDASPLRTVSSTRYPDFTFSYSINQNLISFFNSYPSSTIDENFMTRWAMYANAPLDVHLRKQLYPLMRQLLEGMTPLEGLERLLNWVQTGFNYAYDNEVWGCDRAFFGEETLFYPYCDCEDRSILLSHLVRDLLGLDVILVYYPGHLAMAVHVPDIDHGDYIVLSGRRYTICDPTYIGARVGQTMPKMDNEKAMVILLQPA